MNLDELKQDIKNGELTHIIFESMFINDLNIRLVNYEEKDGFFTSIYNWLFSLTKNLPFSSCETCEKSCTHCVSGCSSSCSSGSTTKV